MRADADSPDRLAFPETIQPWTGAALGAGRAGRHWLPRVDYLATGGTIATVHDDPPPPAGPTLTAEAIARSVPGLDEVADIRTPQFMQRPSPSITFADLLRLRDEIALRIADGSAGVVVTQGTDTIEETAFALDLLCAGSAPIVVTGAMRSSLAARRRRTREPARRRAGRRELRRARTRRAGRLQRRDPRRALRLQDPHLEPSAFRSRPPGRSAGSAKGNR